MGHGNCSPQANQGLDHAPVTASYSRAAVVFLEDGGPLAPVLGKPVGHYVPQPFQDAVLGLDVLPPAAVAVPDSGFERDLERGTFLSNYENQVELRILLLSTN